MSFSPMMADVRIGGGRSMYVGLAACAAFVMFGIALTVAPHANAGERAIGVLTIALFGPLPLYGTVRLLRAGCIYVLATDGIRSPLHGGPLIPWADVQGTRIVTHRGRRYLAIDVRDAASRLRQMKSGSRVARRNLRTGLGLITIPEIYAPASLEGLQGEIERRRTWSPTSAPSQVTSGATILPAAAAGLPVSTSYVPPSSARTLRNVTACHAFLLVLAMLAHRARQTPHVVAVGIAVALVLGALAVHLEAFLVGLVTVVVAEMLLVVVDLTVGHHIALATRLLYLFFPLCVLLLATQAWPRGTARHD